MQKIRKNLEECKVLLRNVPSLVTAVFILSVVCMNLMASRELYRSEFFCINSGLALSWISFLCMDCICKRFGAKAATQISVIAMLVNVITVIIFKLLSMTPGHWAAYYSAPDAATGDLINAGLDSTFSSAWYIVMGSAIAMLLSTLVNSGLNQTIGKKLDRGNYSGFAARSLISTGIAQWVDNFVFSAIVSHVFFGWTWTQVIICSTTSMFIELLFEAIFSPVGYKISVNWEKENVGTEYIEDLKLAA
jgi:uncharacterized PurR-regulated membrane protein YhhQ (DUF165 family)